MFPPFAHHSTPPSSVGVLLDDGTWTWCLFSMWWLRFTGPLNRSDHDLSYVERSFMMWQNTLPLMQRSCLVLEATVSVGMHPPLKLRTREIRFFLHVDRKLDDSTLSKGPYLGGL